MSFQLSYNDSPKLILFMLKAGMATGSAIADTTAEVFTEIMRINALSYAHIYYALSMRTDLSTTQCISWGQAWVSSDDED